MLPVPSGIRWDPRSNPIHYQGIQWDPKSTVELHHGIRLDHGSNTAVSREIFWDSHFGIHGHVCCLPFQVAVTLEYLVETWNVIVLKTVQVYSVAWYGMARLVPSGPGTAWHEVGKTGEGLLGIVKLFWEFSLTNNHAMQNSSNQNDVFRGAFTPFINFLRLSRVKHSRLYTANQFNIHSTVLNCSRNLKTWRLIGILGTFVYVQTADQRHPTHHRL